MKIIKRFELAALYEHEMRGLLFEAFNALAKSEPDSPERRNVLASLENIQAELAERANSLIYVTFCCACSWLLLSAFPRGLSLGEQFQAAIYLLALAPKPLRMEGLSRHLGLSGRGPV